MAAASCSPSVGSGGAGPTLPTSSSPGDASQVPSNLALLDMIFPGFSVFSTAVQRYTKIDLNLYIPVMLFVGGMVFVWQYISEYFWAKIDSYFMSTCSLRMDDEAYNYVMAWVAKQRFSKLSRRFIVNTNTNSRSWFTWSWRDEGDENEDEDDRTGRKKKPLSYTPTFGSHYFFYKGCLLAFHRTQNRDQYGYASSQREEISISCFGRNPAILKELLMEARDLFLKRDEKKTSIYRGTIKLGSTEPGWQRCMARTSRPFSTVILNEKVKKELIDDVTDYLDPATRRWYANRGIPYRRGYLLHGPPGTGKSSLSLALAGFFKMRIYIVSLSSITASEENLAGLFAELPRRCVVLLEDIDTAGLTHTRDEAGVADTAPPAAADMVPGQITQGKPGGGSGASVGPLIAPPGRLSLSGLLNILDGVASQEGRVLIMTTNHLELLDKALIRPGRVDMIVSFGRADRGMVMELFKAIYAPLEGDDVPEKSADEEDAGNSTQPILMPLDADADAKAAAKAEEARRKREEAVARVGVLAEQFAAKVPAHEFSPAELQGLLMKHKRNPEEAVARVEEWVVATRKEKQEKELKEAEERRKKEAEEKEAERKKKEEEEKEAEKKRKKKEAKRKARSASSNKKRKGRKADNSSSESSSSDSSSAQSSDDERPSFKKEAVEKTAKKEGEKPVKKEPAEKVGKKEGEKKDGEKDDKAQVSAVPASVPVAAAAADTAAEEQQQKPDQKEVDGGADATTTIKVAGAVVVAPAAASDGKTGVDSGYET